jgi:hypothetical protein
LPNIPKIDLVKVFLDLLEWAQVEETRAVREWYEPNYRFDDSQHLEATAVSKSAREANHGRDTRDEQSRFQKWISDSRSPRWQHDIGPGRRRRIGSGRRGDEFFAIDLFQSGRQFGQDK